MESIHNKKLQNDMQKLDKEQRTNRVLSFTFNCPLAEFEGCSGMYSELACTRCPTVYQFFDACCAFSYHLDSKASMIENNYKEVVNDIKTLFKRTFFVNLLEEFLDAVLVHISGIPEEDHTAKKIAKLPPDKYNLYQAVLKLETEVAEYHSKWPKNPITDFIQKTQDETREKISDMVPVERQN